MQLVHASRLTSTAQHHSDSSTNPEEALFHIILAEVTAGGISLVEYALEQYLLLSIRPVIVLLDTHGDISAARRAIRLGVDAYLLASESPDMRHQLLERAIDQALEQLAYSMPLQEEPNRYAAPEQTMANGYAPTMNHTYTHTMAQRSVMTASAFAGMHMGVLSAPVARLSTIENAIIDCLSHQAGIPVSARAIVNKVMGRDLDEDKAASLLRPHISRLRSKLEPLPQMPQHLLTVRGKGYMVV